VGAVVPACDGGSAKCWGFHYPASLFARLRDPCEYWSTVVDAVVQAVCSIDQTRKCARGAGIVFSYNANLRKLGWFNASANSCMDQDPSMHSQIFPQLVPVTVKVCDSSMDVCSKPASSSTLEEAKCLCIKCAGLARPLHPLHCTPIV